MGEMLAVKPNPSQYGTDSMSVPMLADLGVTAKESERAQKLALAYSAASSHVPLGLSVQSRLNSSRNDSGSGEVAGSRGVDAG